MKIKKHFEKKLQSINSKIWDDYYISCQKGDWVGLEYPTEPLIRYVSNLRKSSTNKKEYFEDSGKELKNKTNFKGDALEVGFGTMANLIFLNKKGFKCQGLEVSKNSVQRSQKYIKSKKIKNIKTSLWKNTDQIPFKSNSFDLVVGLQCVYYNLEFQKFVREIHRVLKPKGRFFFSFFSNKHEYTKYTKIVDSKKNLVKWSQNHPNKRIRGSVLFQPKNKKNLLQKFSKFKNLRIFTYEFDQIPMFQSWWYIHGNKK